MGNCYDVLPISTGKSLWGTITINWTLKGVITVPIIPGLWGNSFGLYTQIDIVIDD